MSQSIPIAWGDIVAECGNYRDGFVAIFRRYEGQPTDEKDGQGRTVKVTTKSFARHLGIDAETFRRWVLKSSGLSVSPQPRSHGGLVSDVRRAARHAPDAVVAGIMSAPESTVDAIFHELKLQRAGIDTSESNRKAADAWARTIVQPTARAVAAIGAATVAPMLRELTEDLGRAISDGALTDELLGDITEAFDEFGRASCRERV